MAVPQYSAPSSIREIVHRYVDAYRTGDTTWVDEIVSAGFVDHSFPAFSGTAGVRKSIKLLHLGFAAIELSVEDCVCSDDTAAIRVVTTATHVGAFAGKPATGKRVTWSSCDFMRIREGKISELWSVQDTLPLLHGIGALDAQAG